jgi:NADP-dependent 3-hydroxy acid dehydrogenase YdfG
VRWLALASGKDEEAILSVDFAGKGRRVAGAPGVARNPTDLAGLFVEGGDAEIIAATDVEDDEVLIDEGGGAFAEEIVRDGELGAEVAAPDNPARGNVEAMKMAGHAQRVDKIAVDGGAGPGGVVDAEVGDLFSVVFMLPVALAGFGMETFDGFTPGARAMDKHEVITPNDGRSEAGAAGDLPDQGRTVLGEGRAEGGLGGGEAVSRTEEMGPVADDGSGGERQRGLMGGEAVEGQGGEGVGVGGEGLNFRGKRIGELFRGTVCEQGGCAADGGDSYGGSRVCEWAEIHHRRRGRNQVNVIFMADESINRSLKGKVAVVTGASSGIGRAVTMMLVERGVRVTVVSRREVVLEELATELGGVAVAQAFAADVSREDDVVAAMAAAAGQWEGRLDILINAAGVARASLLSEGEASDWQDMWGANVMGTAMASREALKYFPEAEGGHIVNVCSLSGHRVPGRGGFYAATKFAVRAVTEGLRQELRVAGKRTRVSQVSPGFVETPMLDDYFRFLGTTPQEAVKYPMLQAEDIAVIVVDLLEKPAHVEVNDVMVRPSEQAT